MIQTKKMDAPWWEKYRKPESFKDSKDFVKGYNQALYDFSRLMGTKIEPGEDYRCATTWGGNQIDKVCEEWKLKFQEKK